MKNTLERIETLYKEFITKHARFANTQYVLPDSKVEYLRQMARASHQTVALCNTGLNNYHFLYLCCEEFQHLFTGEVTVERFFTEVNFDDFKHFMHAWEIAFNFMEGKETDDLTDFSLIFECRMQDCNGIYHRMMFRYLMVEEYDQSRYGQVLLFLKPITGSKDGILSRGIYIINIKNKEFVYAEKDYMISRRELDIIKYSQKGLTSGEIADTLGIKPNTVNNNRRNVLRKLSVRDNSFAAMYLHNMGVI